MEEAICLCMIEKSTTGINNRGRSFYYAEQSYPFDQ
jgi:hypothetical protein